MNKHTTYASSIVVRFQNSKGRGYCEETYVDFDVDLRNAERVRSYVQWLATTWVFLRLFRVMRSMSNVNVDSFVR